MSHSSFIGFTVGFMVGLMKGLIGGVCAGAAVQYLGIAGISANPLDVPIQ